MYYSGESGSGVASCCPFCRGDHAYDNRHYTAYAREATINGSSDATDQLHTPAYLSIPYQRVLMVLVYLEVCLYLQPRLPVVSKSACFLVGPLCFTQPAQLLKGVTFVQ